MKNAALPLLRAWIALVVLSAAVTLLSLHPGKVTGLAIVTIGVAKARVILSRYLGLAQAPAWLRGFTGILILLGILFAGLFLAA